MVHIRVYATLAFPVVWGGGCWAWRVGCFLDLRRWDSRLRVAGVVPMLACGGGGEFLPLRRLKSAALFLARPSFCRI